MRGVLQESVIGSFLFLIYMNDLPDHLQEDVLVFADDFTVFSGMSELL